MQKEGGDEHMDHNHYRFDLPWMNRTMVFAKALQPEVLPDIFTYPENLPNALDLISQVVAAQVRNILFFDYLFSMTDSITDINILSGIAQQYNRQVEMLRKIYFDLTGQLLPVPEVMLPVTPASYCEALQTVILEEARLIRVYGLILYAMDTTVHINMITEIISEKTSHRDLYLFMYTKNRCGF